MSGIDLDEQRCGDCGSKLRGIPAKFYGEPTFSELMKNPNAIFSGYHPCPCAEAYAEDGERYIQQQPQNIVDVLKKGIQYKNKRFAQLMLRTWPNGQTNISRLTREGRWTKVKEADSLDIKTIVKLYFDAINSQAIKMGKKPNG